MARMTRAPCSFEVDVEAQARAVLERDDAGHREQAGTGEDGRRVLEGEHELQAMVVGRISLSARNVR